MNITVNRKTLEYVLDEERINDEIIRFLSTVIQDELNKETIDCDLIDECVSVIETLEAQQAGTPKLTLADVNKRINRNRRRLSVRTKAPLPRRWQLF